MDLIETCGWVLALIAAIFALYEIASYLHKRRGG